MLTSKDSFGNQGGRWIVAARQTESFGESFDYIRDSSIVRQSIKRRAQEPAVKISVPGEKVYNFDWSLAGTHAVVARSGFLIDVIMMKLP
ncbi:hypothetical protein BH24ACI3_BH24ACI3_05450 [soil metagenome]